mmetsp:Transcript_35942/g.41998  ORF Transcript_35942/g.41998 Transcript_35942/m.41998 type:complete len:161 (-) Transcript_35942:131-613(-)
MHQSSRLDPYVIPGYTGYIPSKEDEEGGEFNGGIKSHIPGYAGYIPAIRPENIFGKTYGKATYISKSHHYQQGFDVEPDARFKSLVKDSFVDQRELSGTLAGPMSPTKMVPGYPPDKFYLTGKSSIAGKTSEELLRETQSGKPKPSIDLTIDEIKQKAFS